MKLILEIKEDKAAFILELLNNFKFVKVRPLSQKAETLDGIKKAVEEMKLINKGELQGIPAKELLNEL